MRKDKFLKEVSTLWPVAKGSLALVRKPCIHLGCPACARGDKHPAYIFSYIKGGVRYCMYVPRPLAPILRQAIQNGRRLEEMMKEAGPILIHEYRRKHPSGLSRKRSRKRKRIR